jgi:hypothetical protein
VANPWITAGGKWVAQEGAIEAGCAARLSCGSQKGLPFVARFPQFLQRLLEGGNVKIRLHNSLPATLADQQVFFERCHFRFRETVHRVEFHHITGRVFHGDLIGCGEQRREEKGGNRPAQCPPRDDQLICF